LTSWELGAGSCELTRSGEGQTSSKAEEQEEQEVGWLIEGEGQGDIGEEGSCRIAWEQEAEGTRRLNTMMGSDQAERLAGQVEQGRVSALREAAECLGQTLGPLSLQDAITQSIIQQSIQHQWLRQLQDISHHQLPTPSQLLSGHVVRLPAGWSPSKAPPASTASPRTTPYSRFSRT